ncbi:hypothetical protein [Scytonema hofmannii]|nr:hypothetical protein [Scytonema hofmannii]
MLKRTARLIVGVFVVELAIAKRKPYPAYRITCFPKNQTLR